MSKVLYWIEGHGKPTMNTEGSIGTIYTDIDTGNRYEYIENIFDKNMVNHYWRPIPTDYYTYDGLPIRIFEMVKNDDDSLTPNFNSEELVNAVLSGNNVAINLKSKYPYSTDTPIYINQLFRLESYMEGYEYLFRASSSAVTESIVGGMLMGESFDWMYQKDATVSSFMVSADYSNNRWNIVSSNVKELYNNLTAPSDNIQQTGIILKLTSFLSSNFGNARPIFRYVGGGLPTSNREYYFTSGIIPIISDPTNVVYYSIIVNFSSYNESSTENLPVKIYKHEPIKGTITELLPNGPAA